MKRALEKMASWFGKKGVALSVAGLTPVLSTEMRKAAPVGLVMANGVELGRVGSSWVELGRVGERCVSWPYCRMGCFRLLFVVGGICE
jgi:hypothetical protein